MLPETKTAWQILLEVSPPGWSGTTRAMKDHGIENPWALAWWMKDKGMKSHKKPEAKKAKT